MESHNVNPNGANIVEINLKLVQFFFSENGLIEFKIILQNFFFPLEFSPIAHKNLTFHIFHLTYLNRMDESFPCIHESMHQGSIFILFSKNNERAFGLVHHTLFLVLNFKSLYLTNHRLVLSENCFV